MSKTKLGYELMKCREAIVLNILNTAIIMHNIYTDSLDLRTAC